MPQHSAPREPGAKLALESYFLRWRPTWTQRYNFRFNVVCAAPWPRSLLPQAAIPEELQVRLQPSQSIVVVVVIIIITITTIIIVIIIIIIVINLIAIIREG